MTTPMLVCCMQWRVLLVFRAARQVVARAKAPACWLGGGKVCSASGGGCWVRKWACYMNASLRAGVNGVMS